MFNKISLVGLTITTKNLFANPHGAEISVIWLIEQNAIKLLILQVTMEKQTLRSR